MGMDRRQGVECVTHFKKSFLYPGPRGAKNAVPLEATLPNKYVFEKIDAPDDLAFFDANQVSAGRQVGVESSIGVELQPLPPDPP